MRLRNLLAAAPAGLILAISYVSPALAPTGDAVGLPAPGVLTLVVAAIVGTILLARRGK